MQELCGTSKATGIRDCKERFDLTEGDVHGRTLKAPFKVFQKM